MSVTTYWCEVGDDLAAFARTVLEQVDARRAGPDAD